MRTVYTVIFGDYDNLKEPLIITSGWRYLCFTDQPLTSDVWEIIQVDTWEDKRMHSREYKINFDRYIDAEESIYIDGSFQINCDLNQWWADKFQQPTTFIKHPRRNCVFDEIERCILHKRCDIDKLTRQRQAYKGQVKKGNGVIQSGIMMRQRTPEVIGLMREWWDELQKYSTRDQISMAFVARNKKLNTITWNYAKATEFIFLTHYCRRK
jgi:hypothetical protein